MEALHRSNELRLSICRRDIHPTNNVEYFGCDNKLQGGRAYRGRIGNDQLRFIDNVLRNVPQDDLIVVSMHIPLQSFDNPDGAADTTIDRTALLRLLSHRPYSASFRGILIRRNTTTSEVNTVPCAMNRIITMS